MKKRILIASTALMLMGGAFFSIVPIQSASATNYTVHWYKKDGMDIYFKDKFTPSCRPSDYTSYTYMGVVTRSSPGISCVTPL